MKPIETRYDGHLFRSRREARQAVFFNELGIEYQYEPEGYDLEGTRYLPDFYLPRQDCFVEVKGQEPTYEELRKVKLLSLYTGKSAYLSHGEIGGLRHKLWPIYGYEPPCFYACQAKSAYRIKGVPPHLLHTVQKLTDGGIDVVFNNGEIMVKQRELTESSYDETYLRQHSSIFSNTVQVLKTCYQDGLLGLDLFAQHQKELATFYRGIEVETSLENLVIKFSPQEFQLDHHWGECPCCHTIGIAYIGALVIPRCKCYSRDDYPKVDSIESPRIHAAYEAARSSRFEFGWKGSTK